MSCFINYLCQPSGVGVVASASWAPALTSTATARLAAVKRRHDEILYGNMHLTFCHGAMDD